MILYVDKFGDDKTNAITTSRDSIRFNLLSLGFPEDYKRLAFAAGKYVCNIIPGADSIRGLVFTDYTKRPDLLEQVKNNNKMVGDLREFILFMVDEINKNYDPGKDDLRLVVGRPASGSATA